MEKTTFEISKMDCPSEENLIRINLDGISAIKNLDFDIPNRRLSVFHDGQLERIESSIVDLNLGGRRLLTEESDQIEFGEPTNERKLLWTVLGINFAFFVVEMTTGLVSGSMGLVADSLDMLADSLVYALALFAVGGTLLRKKRIAGASGYFQLILALFGLSEVVRRFLGFEEVPAFQTMIVVSALALIGNAASLYLLQKSKNEEAHMQASVIFTSNDVVINIGVIVAGALVFLTDSKFPDLVVGLAIFIIVGRGALRILRLAKK